VTRRLLLGYVAIVLVLAGSLAVPFGLVFAQRQRERFAVALERDAVVLGTIYEDALQHGGALEPRPAYDYAARTGARVVVVDRSGMSSIDTADGDPASFTNRPEIVTALAGSRYSGTRFSETLGADLFVVAVPVASGSEVFGAIRLTVLNREVEARVRRLWASLGLVVLVAVAATAVVAVAVARSVTHPVEDLRRAATRIAAGDLSARAGVADAPPELAQLAESFNDMASRLETLVESQRAFVADASHQLRTPLTALRLRVENLEASTDAATASDLAEVVREVERMSRMVDQLLELSRSGQATVESVDLAGAVTRRMRLWEGVAAEKAIELDARVDAERCRASVVPGGLEQILDNLIDNAVRYTPPGGEVVVSIAHGDHGGCILEVRDTGPGVTDEDRRRLFDRFWRGASDEPGTGLGLSIVAHLVERSGGSLTAENAADGGLVVRVTFQP